MFTRLMRYYEDHISHSLDRKSYLRGVRGQRFMMSGTSALPRPLRMKWFDLTDGKRILERYGTSEFSTGILTPLRDSQLVPDVCPETISSLNLIRLRYLPLGYRDLWASFSPVAISSSPTNTRERSSSKHLACSSATTTTKLPLVPHITRKATTRRAILGAEKDPISLSQDELQSTVSPPSNLPATMSCNSISVIKSGGYKISALDIERELLALDYISEASVLGVADEEFGQRVAAVVVLRDVNGGNLRLKKLRDDLRGTLSGYKLPTVLYVTPELVRTASGKVQKKLLRQEVFESGRHVKEIQVFDPARRDVRAKL